MRTAPVLITFNGCFQLDCQFSNNRTQAVKHGKQISEFLQITASRPIIQGSGIGQSMYIAYAADLRTLSALDLLFKYAEDTTLLVPENTVTPLVDEFQHILSWAHRSRLKITTLKRKKLFFTSRIHEISLDQVLSLTLYEQVSSAKLLGFICSETLTSLSPSEHVDYVISMCNQRLYLLNQLKKLCINWLTLVFRLLLCPH